MSVLLLVALCALPERVEVKTPTASFTATHDLAIDEGHLWWRPHGTKAWALFPPDGLPIGHGRLEQLKAASPVKLPLKGFERPTRVDFLSADGDNVVTWGADGRVYYAKLSTQEWVDVWGPTGGTGPLSVKGLDAVAMSHRMIAYTDIDENPHPASAGVTTFYALADGGRALRYADPWLPPRFEHTLCLPERGHLVAASLSASASTLFVMDGSGRTWTRLVDFDTAGDDPALPYTWKRERRLGLRKDVRSLPAEDWRAQPRIDGWHTTTITIAQDGPTNADRELRVEGRDGYWVKPLLGERWAYVQTGAPAQGKAIDAAAVVSWSPPELTLTAQRGWPGAKATLVGFNVDCSPASVVLETPAGERVELPLHFHGGLLFNVKKRALAGALMLPKDGGPQVARLRLAAAGDDFLEVKLEVTDDAVVLRRPPLLDVRFPRK